MCLPGMVYMQYAVCSENENVEIPAHIVRVRVQIMIFLEIRMMTLRSVKLQNESLEKQKTENWHRSCHK